ncbi:MAG: SAM-dependent methyltransferase, partial [Pseudomonadota bacterium]
PMRLFQDLRGMGETSSLAKGAKTAIRRDVILAASERLKGQELLFEMLVMTGWAPHPSQQQPLKPGSAKTSMADAVRKAAQTEG